MPQSWSNPGWGEIPVLRTHLRPAKLSCSPPANSMWVPYVWKPPELSWALLELGRNHRGTIKTSMESMEWVLAETPANFLFHVEWGWNGDGMIHSIWIPHEFHIWIPWNKFNSMVILLESQRTHLIWLPEIVATSRIEHWAPWEIMWFIDWALLLLYYVGIGRSENKFNKSCNSLATHKSSIGQPQCSICHHQ